MKRGEKEDWLCLTISLIGISIFSTAFGLLFLWAGIEDVPKYYGFALGGIIGCLVMVIMNGDRF